MCLTSINQEIKRERRFEDHFFVLWRQVDAEKGGNWCKRRTNERNDSGDPFQQKSLWKKMNKKNECSETHSQELLTMTPIEYIERKNDDDDCDAHPRTLTRNEMQERSKTASVG